MELPTPKHFQSPPIFESNVVKSIIKDDPFADPLCNLNLKETSEFVKSLPMPHNTRDHRVNSVTRRRVTESPSTPGRPVFGFSVGKKNFPSKWDEAEKWLVCSSPCNDSPSAHSSLNPTKMFNQTEHKVSKHVSKFIDSPTLVDNNTNPFRVFNGAADFHLKDKFMDNVEPNLPTKEGFVFNNSVMKVTSPIVEVQHRDIGTEMTPLGSSTTSRCPTPFLSNSPARHNTPASRSGPFHGVGDVDDGDISASIHISQLQECHLAKLQLQCQYDSVTSNWSSREEEEEEISKSLRHFDTGNECRKSISDSRAAAWEEEEKTKCCHRYQREEAKIQAWVNLQNAKAEAESKKLEVKIERMRSNLEEKLMKRLGIVHRKAEDWREAARQHHSDHIHKATQQQRRQQQADNNKLLTWPCHSLLLAHNNISCGCFSTMQK